MDFPIGVFTNKVVLITGASSGIGATCALHFARNSAKLALTGRNLERLNAVAKQCEAISKIKPLVIQADLDKDADVRRIIDETTKANGRLDVLVNNAGFGANASLTDGIHHFDRIMSTNLRSVYLLTSLAIPHLIMVSGNIVNISSVVSVRPTPEFLPYSLSKAALDMFTKCLAKQYSIDGIRVNSVNPGPVMTNFFAAAGIKDNELDAYLKNRMSLSLLGRISTTDDVAELVIFLASDKARSITGSLNFVDNGMLLN